MRRIPTKTRTRSAEEAKKRPTGGPLPSGAGLILGAVFDGMLAASMVQKLRGLRAGMKAGDHNAHALLWELRRAYDFARKNPGVAASLVFVLCSEFLPFVASRMGQAAPEPGKQYSPLDIEAEE